MFVRLTTRERAPIVRSDEQGNPLYSEGPHKSVLTTTNTDGKAKERSLKNEAEWTGKVEIKK